MLLRRMARSLLAFSTVGTSLAMGLSVLLATPAHAASAGTVTVSYAAFAYTVTPSSLVAMGGDTFTLRNTMGDNPNSFVSLVDASGSVTLGGFSCLVPTDCPVTDILAGPNAGNATGIFTVVGVGDVDVYRYLVGDPTTPKKVGTVTLGATAPAPSAPVTATFDPNGGSCTGTLSFTKANGVNGTVTTPTVSACMRENYILLGWARTADARTAEFTPGLVIPIGADNFTLYAVWSAKGVAVTYNANVAMKDQCMANGVNLSTESQRRTTTVVTSASTGQAVTFGASGYVRWSTSVPAAPCTPPGSVLAGWSTSPSGSPLNTQNGDAIVTSGDGLASDGKAGPGADRLTLYAKWQAGGALIISGERTTVGGRPGIVVSGRAPGFRAGDTVVPWVRFPGETSYTQAAARPAIAADGTFSWSRKTGKRTYVYFATDDGGIKSNTVIIAAN